MTDEKIDVYKLVEEVNRQKRDTEKDIDDIYSMLDDVKEVPIDSVRQKVNSMNSTGSASSFAYQKVTSSQVVRRPVVPNVEGDFNSRYGCFVDIINKVNYGSSNSAPYVEGHRMALSRYLQEAENNVDDLHLVEAAVSDEMNKKGTSGDVRAKGYNDGLQYVFQALRKSKYYMAGKVYKSIKLL